MKILLVSPNVEHLPDPVFPLGVAYVAAALEQAGFACHCLDLCFSDDPQAELAAALGRLRPDLTALSLRNVDNVSFPHSVSYLPFYQDMMATIRRHSQAPVVLGGSGFTLLPDELLNYLRADYGIAGEGERALVRLVQHLAGQPSLDSEDLPLMRSGRFPITDLDRLPFPLRSPFDGTRYLRSGGMGNLQTKRGCPFNCIYCTYPLIEGRTVRMRSPESICNEIEMLKSQGVGTLFITDNEFNFPLDHALAVCQEIIRRKIVIKWSAYANPAYVSTELIAMLQAAGCTSLEFGTDAGCEPMLRSMGKGFDVDQIRTAGRLCRQAGMPFCHSLLLGGPGETMATVCETLDTISAQSPTAVICMVGIRIFPRTRLAAIAKSEGRLCPDHDFLKPVFYLSNPIQDLILPFLNHFSKDQPTWIFPGLQINVNATLQSRLRRLGKQGPLWEGMRENAYQNRLPRDGAPDVKRQFPG
jgi:radical SAM superfamily enzyme YgiQ (UPF0313 family)